jgi:hypothetical protein
MSMPKCAICNKPCPINEFMAYHGVHEDCAVEKLPLTGNSEPMAAGKFMFQATNGNIARGKKRLRND